MKWKSKYIPLYAFLIACFSLTLTTILRQLESPTEGNSSPLRDTITLITTDTVYDTIEIVKWKPKPTKETIVKTDTITEGTILETERKLYADTVSNELDTISYSAEIEGINAKMNYIKFNVKKASINTTETNTITITKRKGGWRFAPNVSVGYGLVNRKPDIYVGFGLVYSF